MNAELRAQLLHPISPASAAGEDISYSRFFDDIREARRCDDPLLNQGEWATGIKNADWSRVRQLCEQALQCESKDLQLAAWYLEALTRQGGFAGLGFGLQILTGLVEQYWETLYPAFDPHDLDARAGKFEWVNRQLASVIREIPLTSVQHGAYTWNDWQASREVKNLGLRDLQLREAAIAGGKLSDECFDKSVRESGQQHYAHLATEVANACQYLHQLEAWLDRHMGAQAPSLVDLRQALADCDAVIRQVLAQFGGDSISPHMMLPDIHPQTNSVNPAVTSVPLAGVSVHAGAIASRTDALQALRQVAQYFRINEPHSPVALLAERAARWGEMSLEEWLASVIKDDGTLHQLDELLGVRRG